MQSQEPAPTNRPAIVSVVAAILTILAFCLAVVPIPLTGFICFPAAAMLGVVAVIAGLLSLQQIGRTGHRGREFAWAGLWIGGPVAAASLCMVSIGIVLVPRIVHFIRGFGR